MKQEQDFRRMSRLAAEAADAVAQGSTAGLNLLLAEMQALCALMPGEARTRCGCEASAETEERARATDAEVESSFDNMPV